MKYFITLFASMLVCMITYGQEKAFKTTDVSNKNYYTEITYLNEGEPAENGKVCRVIITTSEIYDNLVIECLTIGEEGGNIKIISKRKVDLESLWSTFHFKGEISGLEFIKWLISNSFSLKVQNRILVFKDIESTNLKVSAR